MQNFTHSIQIVNQIWYDLTHWLWGVDRPLWQEEQLTWHWYQESADCQEVMWPVAIPTQLDITFNLLPCPRLIQETAVGGTRIQINIQCFDHALVVCWYCIAGCVVWEILCGFCGSVVIHKSIFRPKIILDATTSRNLWKFLESFLPQNKPTIHYGTWSLTGEFYINRYHFNGHRQSIVE